MLEKEFIKPNCTKIACAFYGKCCHCAAEVVKTSTTEGCDLMFIGQGAGAEEDQKGKPFQGPAGRVLRTKTKVYLEKEKLNIVLDNTIRSRPLDITGKNRAPTEKEVEHCQDFVWQNIDNLKPRVIVPLGASATHTMLPETRGKSISSLRGKVYHRGGWTFMPTFHPAAILHCREEEKKAMLNASIDKDLDDAVKLALKERKPSNLL